LSPELASSLRQGLREQGYRAIEVLAVLARADQIIE
jgi:hypothetical protein